METENECLCIQLISLLSPQDVKFLCGLLCREAPHHWVCSTSWAVLQAHCGSSGIEAGGEEDGNPGLAVAELLNYSCSQPRPPPFLCSASAETSITVWMNDLRLSPSLNLKWGVLRWFLEPFIWRQLQDTAIKISQNIIGVEIGLKLHQNFSTKNHPEVIVPCYF